MYKHTGKQDWVRLKLNAGKSDENECRDRRQSENWKWGCGNLEVFADSLTVVNKGWHSHGKPQDTSKQSMTTFFSAWWRKSRL